MAELLLEIGLEEIPARMIAGAQAELGRRVGDLLSRERLRTDATVTETYSTPRRLAVHVIGVQAAQSDSEEQMTGPSWSIAFKDGAPAAAAHAFARRAGIAVESLEKVTTSKGEYVSATLRRPGRTAREVFSAELGKELGAIPWPKSMYWRAGKPERYVRPVKWLLALLDGTILPLEFAGVHAANMTYGHRILHGAHAVTISYPREYLATLKGAKVMADAAARRHRVRKDLDHATRTITDARWREDHSLVDTVVHLTEWPSVVLGSFDQEYLALPEEVLVTVMRDHQKYFAVEDKAGKLASYFLAVLNTEADEQGLALIRHGNERVLRARFNDAQFFWNFDQKIPLSDRIELLKSVTFQKDLGNYYEKTERTLRIAHSLQVNAAKGTSVDGRALDRAIELAKVDLTTELVKEFTELQGIVGGLYARAAGEDEKVVAAIYSQYQPASMADAIPPTPEGQLLGLADRIGTIVDMFNLGYAPTGSKDPYALRRAGNAIVKILAESRLKLGLFDLEAAATELSQHEISKSNSAISAFLRERLSSYLREVADISQDVIAAVLADSIATGQGGLLVADTLARAEALTTVRGSEDFRAVSAAFKRSRNILTQAKEKELAIQGTTVYPELFGDDAERSLYSAFESLSGEVEQLREQRDYNRALERIAKLRPHVDLFFDKVMVMVEDQAVRANRLALLALIVSEFSKIADFSEIVSAGV